MSEPPAQVFRRTSRRVLATGVLLALVVGGAGALAGGPAFVGAAWGGGAGLAMALVSAAVLAWPWERRPLLAGSGIALAFATKVVVMIVVVLILSSRRGTLAPGWFFASIAVCLIGAVMVEVVSLARGNTLTVEQTGGSTAGSVTQSGAEPSPRPATGPAASPTAPPNGRSATGPGPAPSATETDDHDPRTDPVA